MHAHTNEPVVGTNHFRPCLECLPLRISISTRGSTGSELRNLRVRLNPRRLIDYEAARETPGDISNREIRLERKFFPRNSSVNENCARQIQTSRTRVYTCIYLRIRNLKLGEEEKWINENTTIFHGTYIHTYVAEHTYFAGDLVPSLEKEGRKRAARTRAGVRHQDPTTLVHLPFHPSQRVPPRSSNLNTFTAHESTAVSGSPAGYLPVDLSIECITFAHVNITRISRRKMARPVRPQRLTP